MLSEQTKNRIETGLTVCDIFSFANGFQFQYGRQNIEHQRKMTNTIIRDEVDGATCIDGNTYRIAPTEKLPNKLSHKPDWKSHHTEIETTGKLAADASADNGKAQSIVKMANGNTVISRDALILLPEGGRLSATSNDTSAARSSKTSDKENQSDSEVCKCDQ